MAICADDFKPVKAVDLTFAYPFWGRRCWCDLWMHQKQRSDILHYGRLNRGNSTCDNGETSGAIAVGNTRQPQVRTHWFRRYGVFHESKIKRWYERPIPIEWRAVGPSRPNFPGPLPNLALMIDAYMTGLSSWNVMFCGGDILQEVRSAQATVQSLEAMWRERSLWSDHDWLDRWTPWRKDCHNRHHMFEGSSHGR